MRNFATCNVFAQITVKEKYYGKDSIPKFVLFEKAKYKNGMEITLFREHLKLTNDDEFRLTVKFDDEIGETHKKYQQYYKGVKVEYGNYQVHLHQNKVKAISGNYVKPVKISTKPVLSAQSSLEIALKHINAKTYLWDYPEMENWVKQEQNNEEATLFPKGELVIWSNLSNTEFRLAYKFDIYAVEPLSRDYVFIDAQTGELLEREPILKNAAATGTLTTRYSGQRTSITDRTSSTSFRLTDLSRDNGINTRDMNREINFSLAVDFIDDNNIWTAGEWNNAAEDDAALEAHWALQQTYDYFSTHHNRNSFDNNNAAINCYVHYRDNWDNGAWDGSRIILGDGNVDFDNVCSVDVLAHELGHAIYQNTCNLRYQGESGALNEGFSDIWAICVENFAAPKKQIWRIGEDITLTTIALRAADNPNLLTYRPNGTGALTVYPDTYQGTGWFSGTWDNGGVHINNTVFSHWFFLLSQGGSGTNDIGNCFNINGICINNAARIIYRMETVYLTANSTFTDARNYAIQSARDLFGFNSNAVIQTTNAWYAVGVGNELSGIITGNNTACNSNTTYTLQNVLSPGTTVNWTKSDNLSYVSGQGTSYYTVKAPNSSTNGSGWVRATISSTGCNPITVEKEVWVGNPKLYRFDEDGYKISSGEVLTVDPGTVVTFEAYSYDNNASIDWEVLPSTAYYVNNGHECTVMASATDFITATAKATNICGEYYMLNTLRGLTGGGGFLLNVSPNPTTFETEVELIRTDELPIDDNTEWEIEVYNLGMKLKSKSQRIHGNKHKIDVSSWKKGVYVIRAYINEEVITKKFIKE